MRPAKSAIEHEVELTADAEADLAELHAYVRDHDSPGKAAQLLERIETALESIKTFPERGAVPGELAALGIQDYRQTLFKPYRIIYRIAAPKVFVYLIVDGRRDMQALLQRRLLRP